MRLPIYIWALCLALTGLAPPRAAGQVTLRITPPMVELRVPPGGLHSFPIILMNDGERGHSVQASVRGLGMDEQGGPVVLNDGGEWSCADWLELSESEFQLPAGGRHRITATIRVPRGVRGGRYAVVLFRTEAAKLRRRGSELSVGAITGTVVMETIPRTLRRRARIEKIGVGAAEQGGLEFAVHFANEGNCHVTASGVILLRDTRGRIVGRTHLEVGTGTVLPGMTRVFPALWWKRGGLAQGTYAAEARVSYQGGPVCRRRVVFRITPPLTKKKAGKKEQTPRLSKCGTSTTKSAARGGLAAHPEAENGVLSAVRGLGMGS